MTERPLRIVGAEWATRYPQRFPARHAPGDSSGRRIGCPICGHPTGDCTGHPEETDMPAKKTAAAPAARDRSTGVPTATRKSTASPPPPPPSVDETPPPAPAPTPPPVAPQMAAQSSDRPVDETSALDETVLRERAFVDAGNGLVTSTRRVLVEFTPQNVVRPSRVLLFGKGQTFSRAQVAHRLSLYTDRNDAHLIYRD